MEMQPLATAALPLATRRQAGSESSKEETACEWNEVMGSGSGQRSVMMGVRVMGVVVGERLKMSGFVLVVQLIAKTLE